MFSREKFHYDIDRGSIGENLCLKLFQNMNNVVKVEDLRDDEFYQKKDIDFAVYTTNNKKANVEVKTDYLAEKTGNIVYERVSNAQYSSTGCFDKTEADYIFYVIMGKKRKVLQINTKVLRDFVNNGNFRYCKMGDNAEGFVIPIQSLYDNGIIRKEYEI